MSDSIDTKRAALIAYDVCRRDATIKQPASTRCAARLPAAVGRCWSKWPPAPARLKQLRTIAFGLDLAAVLITRAPVEIPPKVAGMRARGGIGAVGGFLPISEGGEPNERSTDR